MHARKKKPPSSISYGKSNYQGPIRSCKASWKAGGLDCWISFFRLAGAMPSPNGRSTDSSRNHSTNVMAKNHGSDIKGISTAAFWWLNQRLSATLPHNAGRTLSDRKYPPLSTVLARVRVIYMKFPLPK